MSMYGRLLEHQEQAQMDLEEARAIVRWAHDAFLKHNAAAFSILQEAKFDVRELKLEIETRQLRLKAFEDGYMRRRK